MKLVALFLCLASTAAEAQLLSAKGSAVAMGHHHLYVSDVEASKHFWTLLGAVPVAFPDREVMKLPDLVIFFTPEKPAGGTKGTTVNHIGVQMPDVASVVEKLRASGVPIVTREEVEGATKDVHYLENQDTHIAFVMAPDGTKVELFENKKLSHSIANHHIHFAAPDVDAMKTWYVDMLGAEPGQRGGMEAAQLPGVNLTFSPAASPVTGTRGRALDHIGFEVENLKALCEKLESKGVKFDRPYTERPELGISLAFFTDPWGTYIELTEGLDRF
ncbi:MAG TPA: VOC family protein [Vicinamibacteria bacterium]|nr:VOC family protein [Vicinamibacteria bacterium]